LAGRGREVLPGDLIAGRYRVIEMLGGSRKGPVYKVLDTVVNITVALRLIEPRLAAGRQMFELIGAELKRARSIAHKNVGRIYDLDKEDGSCFITMEYVEGEDLESMIAMMKQLSVRAALGIARQVCEGLAEGHRLGVVHQDIKPANIVIEREGNAKVMDFGLVQSLRGSGPREVEGFIGSPAYMSPEQFEEPAVDPRSDIYSLGVVLFEMLTGIRPLEGATGPETALKHKRQPPPDPRKSNPRIPNDLSAAILKCLKKDSRERFQTASELATELSRIEESLSAVARPSRRRAWPGRALVKKLFLKAWPWAAALSLIIVAAGVTLFLTWRGRPAPLPKTPMLVVLPFENLGSPEDGYFADGISEEITTRLAMLQGLGVISRTSAVQYKKTAKTIKQIGEELGVGYVLEGSVRWDRDAEGGGRIRISPKLIRVSDDIHVWSETYDQNLADIFSLQAEIAEVIARELDIALLEPEREAIQARPTENMRAYDILLRQVQQFTQAYLQQDIRIYEQIASQLEQAVELDPNFVPAYLYLHNLHLHVYETGIDQSKERLKKAKEALDSALRLEPGLPEVQAALAKHYSVAYDANERALGIYEWILRVRPNFPRSSLAAIKMRLGRWDEAIEDYEKAFVLNPRVADYAHVLGRLYALIGKYEESERWFERALSIWPDQYYSKLGLARLPILARGDTQESRARLEKLPAHVLTEYNWFLLGLLERNYDGVLIRLAASPFGHFAEANFYIPIELAYATAYYYKNLSPSMTAYAERARSILEKALAENPEDARYHASLGLAYAYLGREEDAVREGRRAIELYPMSRSAFEAPRGYWNLAAICTVAGEYEEAVRQLQYLMSVPFGNTYSPAILRIDPQWDPLRDRSDFQALLKARSKSD
jgi:TolB-like protein/Tfp pilus assembly protein PilF